MNVAVIDTNILSYTLKKNPIAHLYTPHLEHAQLLISFQTLAELEVWGRDSQWGKKRWAELNAELEHVTVVYPTERTCDFYAKAWVSGKQSGKPILSADAWVAAVALELEIPLVTHNPGDFAGVDELEVITETRA